MIDLSPFNSYRKHVLSSRRVYAFIDGSYFERYCNEIERAIGHEFFLHIDFGEIASPWERLFYYDALPTRKSEQEEGAFLRALDQKVDFLNQVRVSEKCHVRDGVTRLRQRPSQRLEQKGVDILLAIDALQFSQREICEVALVVTADLDFYPLFEALQQLKTVGVLSCGKGDASTELAYAADQRVDLSPWSILSAVHRQYAVERGIFVNFNGSEDLCDNFVFKHRIGDQTGFICKNEAGVFGMRTPHVGNAFSCKSAGPLLLLMAHYGHQIDLPMIKTLVSSF